MMIDTRWDTLQPDRCECFTAVFLIAEARDCISRSQLEEAGFSIGELVDGLPEEKHAA
jgi:hypothetical protein